VRGSGLFVGETGVEANHHFLIPRDGSSFRFTEGRYRLEVFAKLLGDRNQLLFSQILEVPQQLSVLLEKPDSGVYFDWGQILHGTCHTWTEGPRCPIPEEFLDLLGLAASRKSTDSDASTS